MTAANATPESHTVASQSVWENLKQRRQDTFRRPYFDYLNVMLVVALLAAIGIVMVTSASMTTSVVDNNGKAWHVAGNQLLYVLGGVTVMWLAMRLPINTLRRLSSILLWGTILLLIPGIGTGLAEKGSQSWISLGSFRLQPSEIARVAIALWGANILAGHKPRFNSINAPFVKFLAVAGTMFTLILAERDLGMAMTFLLVVVALLFFAGINMRYIAGLGVFVAVGFTIVFLAGGLRGKRFDTFISALFGNFADTKSSAFQSYQGFLSLADGSLTGVGLGQSRAKWFYLPEAKNDFIFAIIGEEMGLMGGALVICLFSWLAYIGFRIAARSAHQFLALTAATLTAGVVAQAFINMGYVVGLLPVTGINLPMISAGGTSAVITLGAMGILANCARHEPDTIAAMANFGKPAFDRALSTDSTDTRPAGAAATAAPHKPASTPAPPATTPTPRCSTPAAPKRGRAVARVPTGVPHEAAPHPPLPPKKLASSPVAAVPPNPSAGRSPPAPPPGIPAGIPTPPTVRSAAKSPAPPAAAPAQQQASDQPEPAHLTNATTPAPVATAPPAVAKPPHHPTATVHPSSSPAADPQKPNTQPTTWYFCH